MRRNIFLSAVLTLLLTLAPSQAMAQHGRQVNLKARSMALATALYKVEQQSDYYKINYNATLLDGHTVDVDVKELYAPDAVDQLLRATPFTATVKGRIINIVRRQQSDKVTAQGRLLDNKGEPLVGATVRVKGTSQGTVTDSDGRYLLPSVDAEAELEYSYIGMKTFSRRATPRQLNIVMKAEDNLLDDVMVTGYQTLKRENATGAFQAITAEDLDDRYVSNLADHLEGTVAGLVSNDGTLQIRGVSTLRASTQPLVVVDGLPISGTMSDINAYEVAKVTVLKDAAAAAIYGARASNGVIVVETKKAKEEKLDINFNADLTFSGKQNLDEYGYTTAAEQIELEEYNFNWMTQRPSEMRNILNAYNTRGNTMSDLTQLLIKHYLGEVSDEEYEATKAQWSKNNYRKEWQDVVEHTRLQQQYNLSLRTKGRYLNSSVAVNWKGDNTQQRCQYDNTLSMQYSGQLNIASWMDADFGLTLRNNRTKTRATGTYDPNKLTSFAVYQSMYDADGQPQALRAYVALDEPSLSDTSLGLKDEGYVATDELLRNFTKSRETYSRSYIHINLKPIESLTLSGMFQYEDCSSRSETLLDGDSYPMRHLYNLYTSGGTHYLPEGGLMDQTNGEENNYTFRAQASYERTFASRHTLSAIAGYEYRQTYSRFIQSQLYGYDEQTLTNNTGLTNFKDLINLSVTDLGTNYSSLYAILSSDVASSTHVKHRYASYYATANYTYDLRYAVSASYRVDKADLFGTDAKFRNRPLYSIGLSWNAHNEDFMKRLTWLDMLKLRVSYGVTGNINSDYSSYLTASIYTSDVHGEKYATLNTPPNDQLRWEKTRTWNWGFDFAVLNHRLSGSLDIYNKRSTDVLSAIDLDPTTGWERLNTNNAETLNKGVELQLSADILKARTRDDFALTVDLSLAYNTNRIEKLNYTPTSGYSALKSYHEGDPVNSLYSFRFDHFETDEDGYQQIYWRKADGTVVSDDISSTTFTTDDVVFCGSTDPKFSGSLRPTLTWKGFSISALFVFYTGHYFRGDTYSWNTISGYAYRYASTKNLLDYWRASDEEKQYMLGNGRMMSRSSVSIYDLADYCDQTVLPADYMKLRSLTLGYSFSPQLCRHIGVQALRLRLQTNDVFKWVANSKGIDPEVGGMAPQTPRQWIMSLNVNF